MADKLDCRYKPVTCSACSRSFECTPMDDYYNSTTDADGYCFKCLLAFNGLMVRPL